MNSRNKIQTVILSLTLLIITPSVLAQWTRDGDASQIQFTSIKKGSIAEVHHFNKFEGFVDKSGKVEINIKLASAETNIAIRNERMNKFLFESEQFPTAVIKAQIAVEKIKALKIGESAVVSTDINISLHGHAKTQSATLTVSKMMDGDLLVTSASPVIVNSSDYGLTKGVDKLRQLANLPTISYAVPVTFSLKLNQ